jgi:6-phosphogluconolactonase
MTPIIRTTLLRGSALLLAFGLPTLHATTYVYVSNATDGTISTYELAEQTGKLTPGATVTAGDNVAPMAVSPNHRYLYANVDSPTHAVQTFAIDPANGALKKISQSPTGHPMAYISLDKTGNYLFASSYDDDVVTVAPIHHGVVADQPTQTLKTDRNTHSVHVDNSNRFLFAQTLGGAKVFQYRFDAQTGKITPNDPAALDVPAGLGPRHIAFSPDNRYVYVLDELQNKVITYSLDPATGQLTQQTITSALPADTTLVPGAPRFVRNPTPAQRPHADTSNDIWAADIHITPDGKYLYTSERTHSTLSALKVDKASGGLTLVGTYPTEKQPRGFAITPDGKYLICAGEKSDRLSVFDIDAATGALKLNGRYPVGQDANWVEVVKF